jgi:uncharacterized protein
MQNQSRKKIWIDLDNSPHVPFFNPIIIELENRGYPLLITARDRFQVCELAEQFHMKYKSIGRYYGKNKIIKLFWLTLRALQLLPTVIKEQPTLALSHGSRSQVLISKVLGIPSVVIFDYEYSKGIPFIHPTWGILPEIIPDSATKNITTHLLKYSGIKEDVYVSYLQPDDSIINELGITRDNLIMTVRPPATEAHYFCVESEKLFESAMDYLCQIPNSQMVLLPRSKEQTKFISRKWAPWIADNKIIIPRHAVNGLNLIWHSDLVISGGGTMNREAAALGVPVYSIFRGKIGAVDKYLSESGRLVLLETAEDVRSKIRLTRRLKEKKTNVGDDATLKQIVSIIEEIA